MKTALTVPFRLVVLLALAIVAQGFALPATAQGPAPGWNPPLATPVAVSGQPQSVTDVRAASELDRYFASLQRTDFFSGVVLVARRDRIIYERAYGYADKETRTPITFNTKFRIASLTKQFTAAAILNLQRRHKLSVLHRACAYLNRCPDGWQNITIHHLLTHTSGIPDVVAFRDYLDYLALPHTPDEIVTRLEAKGLDFKPGTRFNYSNSGYFVLALIIENASGETYGDYLRDRFFEPLGMHDTGVNIRDAELATGYPVGYVSRRGIALPFDNSNNLGSADLYSTVHDLFRWARTLESWRDDPNSGYQAMFIPYIEGDPKGWRYGYGLNFGILSGQPAFGHTGGLPGFATFMMHYPAGGVIEILLSNNEDVKPMFVEPGMAKIVLGQQ